MPDAQASTSNTVPLRSGFGHWIGSVCTWSVAVPALFYTAMLWWWERPYFLDLAAHFALFVGYFLIVWCALLLVITRRRLGFIVRLCVLLLHWASVFLIVGARFEAESCAPDVAGARSAEPATLSILTFNIDSKWIQREEWFQEVLAEHQPDVICFIEAPIGIGNSIDPDRALYPYRVQPEPGKYWSIQILSKIPFELPELAERTSENMFSFARIRSPLLELPGGQKLLLSVFHPVSPRNEDLWKRGQRGLTRDGAMLAQFRAQTCLPVVATGDFNSTPFGTMHRAFARASGLQSHTNLLAGGTWPAALPKWFSLPIDKIWTSDGVDVESVLVLQGSPSDHRAVLVRYIVR
jgi:endonuclease/exonuclease/phosphatase (EEP) superfamily protein YafD